ncbi:MAG: zinc ABC transporter solute-binding protein [Gammaproteobacteria bacterium]|nr:zinc ABC transporter solute-binding protein [Gammaproteobacteria bacterium]
MNLTRTPKPTALKLAIFLSVLAANSASAIDVVATSSSGAMLVREIAHEHANIEILAPPDRDLHYLQARPSMMRALRGADLLVAVGADLELGWLPVAIRQSANPGIFPGRPGYFEFAAQVELVDIGGVADRALGDVHPLGNPHIYMDPVRMATVALALAERLAQFDAHHAADFRGHAAAFAAAIERKLPDWQARLRDAPGVVLFHQDANYLLYRFDVPLLGFLEPVPGIPPTARQLRTLLDSLAGRDGVVLYTTFQPAQAPEALADQLGWPTTRLPLEPPLNANGLTYIAHIDRWVDAIAAGAR